MSLVVPTDEDTDVSDKSDDEKVGSEFGKPTLEKKAPIRFEDAVGRKFNFPFHLCATWSVSTSSLSIKGILFDTL
jgi:hypothetical protein